MFGFGKRKKLLLANMDRFTNMAQMAVSLILMEHSNYDSTQTDEDRKAIVEKSAVWANYLFGKTSSPKHAHLDLEREYDAARDWLKENDFVCELVIQSLRVANMVVYGTSGTVQDLGMDLLESFGAEHPNMPSPTDYEDLVIKAIALLSPKNRQQLLTWARADL